jgi:phospholipid/cholesterol/gamma-HCH transport system substrate-binding protein
MRRGFVRTLAVVAAATLGLTGCGFKGLYSANLPGGPNVGGHPYTVSIDFANVLDLVPQSNVKVNDVAVGKVISVKLVDWHARVKVRVNGNVDLPDNARAAIKMTSLLGEKYVELEEPFDQPSATKLHNGSLIPLTATGTAPEVEEVLGSLSLVLNGGGLQQIRVITKELNDALKGREGAVKDLLTQMNTFFGGLDSQKGRIITAIEKIDKLSQTLNQQKQTIVAALDTFPQALEILKNDRSQLTTLLQSLSRLGATASNLINQTQTAFVSGLQKLSPVLENLTAAGDDLPMALQLMLTFPFPLGPTTKFIRGDYANLGLHLDIELNTNICGLNLQPLCDLINKLIPGSVLNGTNDKPVGPAAPKSAPASKPLVLPGLGG